MTGLLRELRKRYPELLVLGELFGDETMIKRRANSMGINLLLGTPWEHKFVPDLRRYLQYVHRMHDRLRFHTPVSSHDSGSVVEEFGSPLATGPRLVTSVLFGSGSTGMVQGVEYGEPKRLPFIGPPEPYVIGGREDFAPLIRHLNELHRSEPILRQAGNIVFVDRNHEAILAACRIDPGSGEPVFFACANFDTSSRQTLVLPAPREGTLTLKSVLDEQSLRWDGTGLRIVLDPGGIGVYRCSTTAV